jgi:hypothetical protein
MKTIQSILILAIFAALALSITSKTNKNKKINKSRKSKSRKSNKAKSKSKQDSPKAYDLKNHFGTSPIDSKYGPENNYVNHVESNLDTYLPQKFAKDNNVDKYLEFKPYPGFENKFNPHHIKSGDFTNVAPSARDVISPEITGPKIHVQAEMEYPSHVRVPTFFGFKKDLKQIHAYDKLEGRIISDNVVMEHPVYGYKDKVIVIFLFLICFYYYFTLFL